MPGRPRARRGRFEKVRRVSPRPSPGQYVDELSYAGFEVHDDRTVTFGLSNLKVEDLTVVLDALERGLAAERTA
ncbi:hypothetical protein [Streptomyces sp. NPDC007074]|uniref:hypothetical protein n=1 Tax=Streptomyces sp. NPDC007074 TaxID=3156764 RepID=UPI0033F25E50